MPSGRPQWKAAERADENRDDQVQDASVVDLDAERHKNSPVSSLKARLERHRDE